MNVRRVLHLERETQCSLDWATSLNGHPCNGSTDMKEVYVHKTKSEWEAGDRLGQSDKEGGIRRSQTPRTGLGIRPPSFLS